MKENKLLDLSTDFAVKIITLCEMIKGHYSLVNQLERTSTSIGVMCFSCVASATHFLIGEIKINVKVEPLQTI